MTDGFSAIKVQRHREEDVVMRAGAWPSDSSAAEAPALQKGIIVTAVLAVVACIVWYALFMS